MLLIELSFLDYFTIVRNDNFLDSLFYFCTITTPQKIVLQFPIPRL